MIARVEKGEVLGWTNSQKQKSCKIVVSKVSSNVLSKCSGADFHITCVICISATKYVAPPLLIIPGK